jgi:hypothetical protein
MKAKIVTAYVPLQVKHLTADQYHAYYDVIERAVGKDNVHCFCEMIDQCWLYHEPDLPLVPANPVPADRYDSPLANVRSNIVQHNRTTWACRAATVEPDVDVWVWLDYGIAKQGAWRNAPITEAVIHDFFAEVSAVEQWNTIPFPGIEAPGPILPVGNNWRFCGSTHIWPKQNLKTIDALYKGIVWCWTHQFHTLPLDLPIWAMAEQQGIPQGLPFRWYQAEYDASQLSNFKKEMAYDPAL